jgi:epoxyqueuosine reductase
MPSRRDFLKNALLAGTLIPGYALAGQRQGRGRGRQVLNTSEIPAYRHSVIPLDRWPSLKADFKTALTGDGITRNAIFRDSIAALDFGLPTDFPGAKTVVVLATFAKSATSEFKMNGQTHRILIPFQYYADEWTPERLQAVVRDEIVKDPNRRVVNISDRVPLKFLAGRSGLGSFGRNNLIYVEGMGSYCLLHAFLTDAPLPGTADSELQLLGECRHCRMCDHICPTNCMGRNRFIIDAGRCISVVNENTGDFPNWILPSMHHALMGCMKCQSPCPENSRIPDLVNTLEAVPEEMTRKILSGRPDEALTNYLRQKIKLFPAVNAPDFHPILKRNLGVLIRA